MGGVVSESHLIHVGGWSLDQAFSLLIWYIVDCFMAVLTDLVTVFLVLY